MSKFLTGYIQMHAGSCWCWLNEKRQPEVSFGRQEQQFIKQ